MSDVFVSYKSEDRQRIHPLVTALQEASLSVWWDRHLLAGDNWRAGIQKELDEAKCVIVTWTRHSTPGDFVCDEASRAQDRNVLISVLLDKVKPPLGFGELQAIDLSHWKGNPKDAFFEDLKAAIQAKTEGRPAPPPKGPAMRLRRRLSYGSAVTACLIFGLDLFHVQSAVCGVSTGVSDSCGALGLGGRATKAERIAWQAREPGNCAALRAHIEGFPNGAHRQEAASLLSARRVTQSGTWLPVKRQLPLFEARESRAAALKHAQSKAEQLCRNFTAGTLFRYGSAVVEAQTWDCDSAGCGFEGFAICELEQRDTKETETCGLTPLAHTPAAPETHTPPRR